MSAKSNNPFKELESSLRTVPPEMRQKVMNDVAMAKLALDLTLLVTDNYPSALSRTLKRKKGNKKD